ncbi:MAG: hypothetical protein RJB38_280 [Pseudomonadota bacterium]|jgi:tetratricopeptide (TPR) repeat protein
MTKMNRIRWVRKPFSLFGVLVLALMSSSSCSSLKNVLAIRENQEKQKPIENPFGSLYPDRGSANQAFVLRSKRGDQSLEVEIPPSLSESPSWEFPASVPPGAKGEPDGSPVTAYEGRPPSVADREILSRLPTTPTEQAASRRDIEAQMGLRESAMPASPGRSYLGRMDHVKQLYREARYEASLLEIEEMLRDYPLDPKLHEMRGTLLDRMGHPDLAKESWSQALEINPSNTPLRRYLEMKGARAPAAQIPTQVIPAARDEAEKGPQP